MAKIKSVRASILSDDDVRSAIEGENVVVNLVVILCESGNQIFEAVHAEGARCIAEASHHAGVGLPIHMSSLGADLNP